MSLSAEDRIIRRARGELGRGMVVNLGIGLPGKITSQLDPELEVCLHSENGIAGAGPALPYDSADRNLIDAGGAYVSTLPGASFFDSAVSFAMVRGGRIDLAVLGALQVSRHGDLANWSIPGEFTPGVGGGMELAQKARRLLVLMKHKAKDGRPKIVEQCSLPLTAPRCVDRIITELAVFDVEPEHGLVLREIAEDTSIEEVEAATAAPFSTLRQALPVF